MVKLDTLVAHYHEIGLKGRNRNFFEDALTRNLTRALRGTGYKRVRQGFGRVVVDFHEESNIEEAVARAARIFGIVYVGIGKRITPEMDPIGEVALDLIQAEPFDSFAVRARRTHSSASLRSNEINVEIGQRIVDATGSKVDLKHPDATIWVDLFGNTGVVYRRRIRGPGGLPVGVSGRMLGLLSGGIDSPVAGWRMARRGAEMEFVHFHGRPFTDPSSIRQAGELAEVLARYQLRTTLHLIPLADAQREIVTHAPANLRVILYRRTMMRIAAELAEEIGAKALVTGDSLGQVASQTIENIRTVDAALPPNIEVLRPLIGMDKQEIVDQATAIGTYEISTRKYQDCCVLFEPRSPATRSNPGLAEQGESGLEIDALVGKALAGREVLSYELPPP